MEFVRSLPKDGPLQIDNATRLKFYGYFKQATQGDVQGSQPWAVQVEARAKYDAWAKLKGMPREEAMKNYVQLLEEITASSNQPWKAPSA